MAKNLTVEIILAAVDKGVKKTFSDVGRSMETLNRSSQVYNRTLTSLSGTADQFKGTMLRLAGVLGGAGLFAKAAQAAGSFNSTIEQSQIGIAALVRNFTTLGDAPDGYAKSMEVAAQIQQRLQIEGLKTTATYEQLLVALQEGIGPAFKAGFKPDEIVEFTSLMTQAAGAISLPMDQLGQELRAILDGTIDKNARVAKALGLTNEKIKEMAASGKLFEYLKGQLAAFGEAGEAMGRSFTGAWSNVLDAMQMALGTAFQNSFQETTGFLLRLKDAIVTIDEEAGTFTFNEKITAAFEKTDAAISALLAKFSKDEIAEMFAAFIETMGAVATALVGFVSGISGAIKTLGPLAPIIAGVVTQFILWGGLLKIIIGLPLLLYKQIMALIAGFTVLTGQSVAMWLANLRAGMSNASIAAMGLRGAISALVGVFLAWQAGFAVGTWLNNFKIVQKAGIIMAQRLSLAWLRVKQLAIWATFGDTTEVNREIARVSRVYDEMYNEVGRKASAAAKKQKDSHEEVAVVAKASADAQTKALTAAWDAFENRLKSAQRQLSLARSAAELAAAEKALEYAQAGMDDVEAEALARKDKVALLDAEIARYRELLRLVPAAAPKGKSSDDSRAQIEQQINGLLTTRVGLLRDGVEAERKASEERIKKLKKERDAAFKLAEEKARFASHERILALEEEKLEASKLPTALAQAEAEMAIDRRISEERIRLKIAEIAILKSLEGVDPANIIQAEQGLLDLRAGARRTDLENERSIAAERLTILERSWRAGATTVEEYQAAVTKAFALGVFKQREFGEKMVASGNDLSAALSLGWSRAMEKLKTDAEVMTEIGALLPEQLAGGMTSAFDSIIEGSKTAKEAFVDFARSTLKMIAQMIMQQMILNAISSFTGKKADGGPIQKLASGGRVHGSSPNERADNVPIWATAGEFMQPVRAVQKYGVGFMEAVRSLRFPAALARSMALASLPAPRFSLPSFHLASGGPVPRAAAAPAAGNTTNLQVVNVLDKGLVGDYLSTSHGETTILNMIRRNGTTIKALLGH